MPPLTDDLMRRGGGGAQRPGAYLPWWIKWGLSSSGDTLEDWEKFVFCYFHIHDIYQVRLLKSSQVGCVGVVSPEVSLHRSGKVGISCSRVCSAVCGEECRDMSIEAAVRATGLTAVCFMSDLF